MGIIQPPQYIQPPAPTLLRTLRLFGDDTATTAVNATLHQTIEMAADFAYVRVGYALTGGTAQTINKLAFAASASLNDGYTPLDGAGASAAWVNGTFAGTGAAAAALVPLDTAGANATIAQAVPGVADAFAYTFSDWAYCPSLPRTDGGTKPLLMIRDYRAAVAGSVLGVTNLPSWNTASYGGRVLLAFQRTGDYITAPATFSPPNVSTRLGPVIIQTVGRTKGHQILGVGDSNTAGTGSTAKNGWLNRACALLSTTALPITPNNAGFGGLANSSFVRIGRDALRLFRPQVVFIATLSPNGPSWGTATCDASLNASLSLADLAVSLGAVPVLWTAPPWSGSDATGDNARKAMNTTIRALGTAGRYLVSDFDAAVTDGATPARMIAALTSDGTHFSEAGQEAAKIPAAAAIRRALRL